MLFRSRRGFAGLQQFHRQGHSHDRMFRQQVEQSDGRNGRRGVGGQPLAIGMDQLKDSARGDDGIIRGLLDAFEKELQPEAANQQSS